MQASVTIMYHNDELSWLFTNRFSATRYMKVRRMGILQKFWEGFGDFLQIIQKSSKSFRKQPTQIIVELNSSLRHIFATINTVFLTASSTVLKKIFVTLLTNYEKSFQQFFELLFCYRVLVTTMLSCTTNIWNDCVILCLRSWPTDIRPRRLGLKQTPLRPVSYYWVRTKKLINIKVRNLTILFYYCTFLG